MIVWLVLALANPQSAAGWQDQCASPTTEQEKTVCEYIERANELEIRTVESIAVGGDAEMRSLRPQARKCGLINQIDYVAPNASVFRIINARQPDRDCLVSWVKSHAPEMIFTEEKLQALIAMSSQLEGTE